jgi:hypothetical protein
MDIFIRQCEGMNDFEAMMFKHDLESKFVRNVQGKILKVTAPREPPVEAINTE